MKLIVSIDVSSKDMKACLMNFEGDTLQTLTVNNDLILIFVIKSFSAMIKDHFK